METRSIARDGLFAPASTSSICAPRRSAGDILRHTWGPIEHWFGCRSEKEGKSPMSFVTTQPEPMLAAASDLQAIGSAVSAGNAAAASPTTGVIPAAADEVSAVAAAQFAAHAQMYQEVSGQAAAIHEMFVSTLGISAGSYAATEAANASATG
jgi:hypothetical protein